MTTDYDIISTYSQPLAGGDLAYFVGKQYGAGWLQTIGRIAFPILKRLGQFFGKTAKQVVYEQKPILSTLKENAIDEVGKLIPGAENLFKRKQKNDEIKDENVVEGSGLRKRRKTINKRKRSGTIFQ